VAAAQAGDAADDELLLSIERILSQEPAYASLVPGSALRKTPMNARTSRPVLAAAVARPA